MRRLPFAPQEDSWYSFLLDAESTPGAGRIMPTGKSNYLNRNGTHDLSACSIVPQPTTRATLFTSRSYRNYLTLTKETRSIKDLIGKQKQMKKGKGRTEKRHTCYIGH
jgi:hypothetical protein